MRLRNDVESLPREDLILYIRALEHSNADIGANLEHLKKKYYQMAERCAKYKLQVRNTTSKARRRKLK